MRVRYLKLLIPLSVAVVGLLVLLTWSQITRASHDAPELALSLAGDRAQLEALDFQKVASSQVITLGERVTYTVSIKNNGAESVEGQVTDSLPAPLILQTDSVTATAGQAQPQGNSLSWHGTIPGGGQVDITYAAVPPTTSQPVDELTNTAIFDNGGGTLEARSTISTEAVPLGLWGGFVNLIALALIFFDESLVGLGLPYAFGFAIILFTVVVRVITFPLNMQQMRSSLAMQELQPKIKELQKKYANDKEKLNQETMKMYQEAGVNPLGGCLPMLVQMPVWFALYRALFSLAQQGVLTEGFLWIPSLAGPVTNRNGGLEWLFPLVNGAPPIGWADAIAYLVLPVLLVVSQLITQRMMTPANPDPQQKSMNQMMMLMPLMFGYFSLVVPSGLTLYWFTSNLLSIVQQYVMNRQRARMQPAEGTATPSLAAADASGEAAATVEGKTSKRGSKNARRKRKSRK